MTCYLLLIGASAPVHLLRQELEVPGTELDTDIAPRPEHRRLFPETDAVVCVTQNGCSCSCVAAFSDKPGAPPRLLAPALGVRGALTQATVRFAGIRVLIAHSPPLEQDLETFARESLTLAELLTARRLAANSLLDVKLARNDD